MTIKWLKDPKTIMMAAFLVIIIVLAILINDNNFSKLAAFALCVLTAIYAFATILIVFENRRTVKEMQQSRLDAVKPALSLQPGLFYDGGSFGALYIHNSGGVAKEVKVDIKTSNPKMEKHIFLPALNRGYRIYLYDIPVGKLRDTGGLVEIAINYKDSYNQSGQEHLSFDFAALKAEGREVIAQESENAEVNRGLKDIQRELNGIKSEFSGLKRGTTH